MHSIDRYFIAAHVAFCWFAAAAAHDDGAAAVAVVAAIVIVNEIQKAETHEHTIITALLSLSDQLRNFLRKD